MPKPLKCRKRFRAALALAGLSMREWAKKEGLSAGHVSQVLSGRRESAALTEKIEAFSAKQLESQASVAA